MGRDILESHHGNMISIYALASLFSVYVRANVVTIHNILMNECTTEHGKITLF